MALPVFATAPSEDLTSSEITEWDLGNNMVLVAGEPTVIETTEDNSSNRAISPRTTRTYSYPFYIRFEGESRNNIIFTATVRTFGTSGDWIFLDNGTYTYTVNNNLFSVLFFCFLIIPQTPPIRHLLLSNPRNRRQQLHYPSQRHHKYRVPFCFPKKDQTDHKDSHHRPAGVRQCDDIRPVPEGRYQN